MVEGGCEKRQSLQRTLNPSGSIDAMRVNTYLNYGGNCAEAFKFYEEHLGGKIGMMMKHGEMPDPNKVLPEWKDAVLYATITIGDALLMASDVPKCLCRCRKHFLRRGLRSCATGSARRG
jgi:hypothetical protein